MPKLILQKEGNYYVPSMGGAKFLKFTGESVIPDGQSNYTGTGTAQGVLGVGTKASPFLMNVAGGLAGLVSHVQQNVAMVAGTNILAGLYVTANLGNVVCTNGELIGADIYVRNPGTGTLINGTGQRIMVYVASGAQAKYKKGLLIDVLDMATSHPSGSGTQGLIIQLKPTSVNGQQVDAILINQNSAQAIASGITFNGKIGATNGLGGAVTAVINFIGTDDGSDNEGNKTRLFKFRSGGANYTVTPAQFKTALGDNCTAM